MTGFPEFTKAITPQETNSLIGGYVGIYIFLGDCGNEF